MWPFAPSYVSIVEGKKIQQREALARAGLSTISNVEDEQPTSATATEIVARIQKGEWTASQVVDAYIAKAVQAHAVTNCLTEASSRVRQSNPMRYQNNLPTNTTTGSGCDNFSALAASTILYNVLDHPAGCLPVTHIDPSKDLITPEWIAGAGHGSPYMENGLYHGKAPLYDPVQSAGMPVGIQVVGKKWEEEKVLAMMHVIDDALGKDRGFGPNSWKAQEK
ncbi:hypothetical protein H0H87_008398 [Tephrocybe sp. NHM501043]|nr:hypothetical protein H0H87_008398 [Tephrocybe sp. NHM501043]